VPYLRVVKTLLVRRTPVGTCICVPFNFMLESFSPIIEIDESVESVLALCDGTKTREDILNLLSKESGEPIEAFADDLDELVEYFVGEGVLEWNDEPSFLEPLYNQSRPFSISIEITSVCNLRCPFCSVDAGEPRPDDVTLDDIIPFVEQVKKFKPTPLAISGGEPLLKKETLLYMLRELSPVKEMDVSVFTNGTLITKDYAQQLHDAGMNVARVSVDGHTEELHDSLRGKGTFKKTIEGIEYLRELGIHINIVSVISRLTYPYLREIRDFVKEISDSFNVSYVYPYGRAANSELLLTQEEIFNVKTSNSPEKIETNISPRNRCHTGETICVAANGDIFPCLRLRLPEFRIGNIKENNLTEIYNNTVMQEVLDLTVKDIEQCRTCTIRYYCGGACRGFAKSVGGSLYGPDPINCVSNRMLTRKILENGEENTKRLLEELLESTKKVG
jgi:radical SAM protein with 4Fe4S-binding SPASM domain